MNRKMKISVLIPAYNAERYIAQCIENVLCQTYKEIEIVVVNDGSTDHTAEIAAAYPQVRLVNIETNGGVAAARNAAIEAATGEYFHFLDADDRINLDFYAKMIETVRATDADMVFCSVINELLPHMTLIYDRRWVTVEAEDKYSLSMTKTMGYSWRYLCRKSMVTEHAIAFHDGRMLEDAPFTVQVVYHANKVATAPEAVYHYKMRANSSLLTKDKERARKMHEHWKWALKFCEDFLAEHNLSPRTTEARPVSRYLLFGSIPVLKKVVSASNGKTKWFIFGIPVLKKTPARSSSTW